MTQLIKTQTEDYLRKTKLPEETKTYTVISHGIVIDTAREMLEKYGFNVLSESYQSEHSGDIAYGLMKLEKVDDPDMAMTFYWTNSYNKMVKFKCSIGGFIYDNEVPFITSDNQATWNRKHTGVALDETLDIIESMIASAEEHFAQIVSMKNKFKEIPINRKDYAKLMGLLYFDKKIIAPTQASLIRNEYDKPSFNYSDKETLWELYKIIMFGISDQPPRGWYSQQIKVNNYLQVMYNIATVEIANENVAGQLEFESVEESFMSEDELAHELYGVDNDIEVSLPVLDEVVDLDAEEDAEWDRLEAAGVIAPCIRHDAETIKEIEIENSLPVMPNDEMDSVENLIQAQNLVKEKTLFKPEEPSLFDAVNAKKERLEEIRESIQDEDLSYGELVELQELTEFIEDDDVELLEAAGVPEFTEDITIDLSDLEGEYTLEQMDEVIEILEERLEQAVAMSEKQVDNIKEEHGIIEKGNPDDGLIGSTAPNPEDLFDLIDDEDDDLVDEVPWFTDENPNPEIKTAPSLIPDDMRDEVLSILMDRYQNTKTIKNTIEGTDHVLFILDSEEFFTVDKQ
jgi:hypothetical protein